MTMPIERMRSVRWGAQLLADMQVDTLVPSELQLRAAELSHRYPDQARLLELLSEPRSKFPRDLALILVDAGRLFEGMDAPGRMTPATRDLLRYTLRHFPSRANGWHRVEDFELFCIEELLEVENDACRPCHLPSKVLSQKRAC